MDVRLLLQLIQPTVACSNPNARLDKFARLVTLCAVYTDGHMRAQGREEERYAVTVMSTYRRLTAGRSIASWGIHAVLPNEA